MYNGNESIDHSGKHAIFNGRQQVFLKMGLVRWTRIKIQCSIPIHCFKKHPVRYDLYFQKIQDRSGCNRSARVKRELSRENAYYKRGCFIHVTCNMNAKGQAWNENIWTLRRPYEKIPIKECSEVGPWLVAQIYTARKLAFSNINRNRNLGEAEPDEPMSRSRH